MKIYLHIVVAKSFSRSGRSQSQTADFTHFTVIIADTPILSGIHSITYNCSAFDVIIMVILFREMVISSSILERDLQVIQFLGNSTAFVILIEAATIGQLIVPSWWRGRRIRGQTLETW